jgi:hypothetical protein
MGKPYPVELREGAVRLVEQGSAHTEAAQRLCFSIKFINDKVRLKRGSNSLAPKTQGNPGRGKLLAKKAGWRSAGAYINLSPHGTDHAGYFEEARIAAPSLTRSIGYMAGPIRKGMMRSIAIAFLPTGMKSCLQETG